MRTQQFIKTHLISGIVIFDQRGTVFFLDGKDFVYSLPVAIMKKIAEHPNVSVVFTYIYNGVKYTTVIPTGAPIDTSIEWFGPAYLMCHCPTVVNQEDGSQVQVNAPI